MYGIEDLDIENSPYAEWLEGMCRSVIATEPDSIGLVATGIGGRYGMTAYYEADTHSKGEMLQHILSDIILEVVENNADHLRELILADDEDYPDDDEIEEDKGWRDTSLL